MEGQTSGSDLTGSEQDLRERAIRQLKRKREFRDHLGWFTACGTADENGPS